AQERLQREQEVTGNGHILAMAAATSAMSPSARLGHEWAGLEGLRRLKALDDGLDDAANLEAHADRLRRLRDALLAAPRQLLVVGEESGHAGLHQVLMERWGERANPAAGGRFVPAGPEGRVHHAWTTNTQVNFCARAYPAVAPEHPDAPALLVLGGFLRNGFLHRAIREQGGAYGGGASFDPDAGAFRFFSYRDPRLGETLDDFDAAVRWLLDEEHEWRTVEEAILGAVGGIDKPGSPAGEAKKAFYGGLYGRTPAQRRRFRARVLDVRLEDLRRVGESYLTPERAHTAVITSTTTLQKYQSLGLEPVRL
ncbi:MAG TPA: insulinase family protein, partial [Gammaproteobacteria bacterium]|nr:insulinase family protein [Gammaproteobacteria bacterium]